MAIWRPHAEHSKTRRIAPSSGPSTVASSIGLSHETQKNFMSAPSSFGLFSDGLFHRLASFCDALFGDFERDDSRFTRTGRVFHPDFGLVAHESFRHAFQASPCFARPPEAVTRHEIYGAALAWLERRIASSDLKSATWRECGGILQEICDDIRHHLEGDGIQSFYARALLDLRPRPPHLVAVRHLAQQLARLARPAQLLLIKRLDLLQRALQWGQLLDRFLVQLFELFWRGAADGADRGFESACRISAILAEIRDVIAGRDALARNCLGYDAHRLHGGFGKNGRHRLFDHLPRDHRVPTLHRPAVNRRTCDLSGKIGRRVHKRRRLLR